MFGFSTYDVIRGTTIDYMHCVLFGVVKNLLELWFDVAHKDQPWSVHKAQTTVNDRLHQIQPPNIISRRPRFLDDLTNWKASEFRSFLLFYAGPVLYDLLPNDCSSHFMLLVYSISILLKSSISSKEINRASVMLKLFCLRITELYGPQYNFFNVHSLLHLTTKVNDLGPLWAHSCFFMRIFMVT